MPRTRRFHNVFLGGEISPQVYERYDFDKRSQSLARLENMLPTVQGPVKRRDGSRFVVEGKLDNSLIRLIPFVFSRTQAYILELGEMYMRFYRDEGQLIDAGSPVELVTPWTAAQIRDIDFAQDADTMFFVHPDVTPQILRRFDDVTWSLTDLNFRPPPTQASNYVNLTDNVTLSALSGSAVTVTGPAVPLGTFRPSDVGRTFRETRVGATGLAVVTGFTSQNVITINVFEPFANLVLSNTGIGTTGWQLDGSPLANVAIVEQETGEPAQGSVGELITLIPYIPMYEGNGDEITNGDFTTLPITTDWDDLGGALLATGTATAPAVAGKLTDVARNFKENDGVQVNHKVSNLTSPREGSQIIATFESTAGGPGFDTVVMIDTTVSFMVGDTYEIRDTGFFEADGSGGVVLNAGENGTAWLEQDFSANQRSVYEYVINTSIGSISIQAGTASGQADVLSEVTINPGETRVTFTTPNVNGGTTFTLFFQLRNNQFNTKGKVDSIAIRRVAVDAFALQAQTVGTYIRLNGGYVQTTQSPTVVVERLDAIVVTQLDDTQDVLSGAWTIEDSLIGKDGGFPQAVAFFQGRLWLAVANNVFGSVINRFSSFALGADPGDAIFFTPNANEINPIHWIVGEIALILGNRGEEFSVNGTETSTIRAGDIDLTSPTGIGTEPIQPVRVRDSLILVKSGGKRLFEMAINQAVNERVERDLSILAEHLIDLDDKLIEIAWLDEPQRTLWLITENGQLRSFTYLREHNIWAWARHGASDTPQYQSVAAIPHPSGNRDQLWHAVKRTSSAKTLIEFYGDDDGVYDNEPSTMVDSTLRYSGASTTTITGLVHLQGLSNVWVVDALGPQGPFSVNLAGELTGIPRAVTEADIGIYYDPNLTTLRPEVEETGPTGLLIGKIEMYVRLFNTGDGVLSNGKLLKLRRPTDLMDSRIVPVTGERRIPSIGTDRDAIVTLSQSIPETFEVQSIAGSLEVEDI